MCTFCKTSRIPDASKLLASKERLLGFAAEKSSFFPFFIHRKYEDILKSFAYWVLNLSSIVQRNNQNRVIRNCLCILFVDLSVENFLIANTRALHKTHTKEKKMSRGISQLWNLTDWQKLILPHPLFHILDVSVTLLNLSNAIVKLMQILYMCIYKYIYARNVMRTYI